MRVVTTPPVEGPAGTAGAQGQSGADGAQGTSGSAGSQGLSGPPGPAGASSGVEASVNSDAARRLLQVDRIAPLDRKGPFAGQLRVRVACKRGAVRRCEGTVKVRTLQKVNTAFKKGRRVMKRVTLGTGSYRLNRGQIGYGKALATPLAANIVALRGPVKVEVLVTVLDEKGGQQTLRSVFKIKSRG